MNLLIYLNKPSDLHPFLLKNWGRAEEIGVLNSQGLHHWRIIKKEKKNG